MTAATVKVKGRLPPQLTRCPGCQRHIYPQAQTCPLCGGKLAVLRRKQLSALAKADAAIATLRRLLGD